MCTSGCTFTHRRRRHHRNAHGCVSTLCRHDTPRLGARGRVGARVTTTTPIEVDIYIYPRDETRRDDATTRRDATRDEMAWFDVDVVERLAREYGYTKCQCDPRQGLRAYRRATTCDGTPEIVRVWCGTRTVETQLKHPNRPARTALFRRNVPHYKALGGIFDNPRTHTGTGYYRDPEKDTPCPGCGRKFRGAIGSVCHYECGKCRSNPCASSARRTAYEVARRAGADFLVKRIAYGEYATDSDESDGYESDGYNYRCNACGKEFKLLNALMQHQKNRSQCQHLVSQSSRYMLSA